MPWEQQGHRCARWQFGNKFHTEEAGNRRDGQVRRFVERNLFRFERTDVIPFYEETCQPRHSHRPSEIKRWAQVTAREPSPTAKPTLLVEPERMSPAARHAGNGRFQGQGSRSATGHVPARRDVGAGQQIASRIAGKLSLAASGRRLGADENEDGRAGQATRTRRCVVSEHDRFDAGPCRRATRFRSARERPRWRLRRMRLAR